MLSNSWETSCRSLKYWTALQICMSWRKKFGNYLDTSHVDTQHSSDPPAEELSHGHAFIVIDHNKDRISRSVTMQFCLFGAFDGDKNHEHEQKITRTNLLTSWPAGSGGAVGDQRHSFHRHRPRTICSCRALPAGTIGYTCSDETTHSITIGRVPSYSRNSFIIAGRSASLVQRIALAPIASASLGKSGLCIRV